MGFNKIMQDSLHYKILTIGSSEITQGSGCYQNIHNNPVHLWFVRYSTLDRYYPLLSALVSSEEMVKAEGFKKIDDKRRYVIRHGLLRAILERYTQVSPVELSFMYGMNGKPELDPGGRFSNIRFSLSRTDEMVCVGITRKSAIGLDIVRTQPRFPFSAIEHYLFTPGERQWIVQAVPDRRSIRFFRVWALKEALLKAIGGDVRIMKEADVSHIMTDPFLNDFYDVNLGGADYRYFIRESVCGTGHHCALAVKSG